VVDPFVEVYAIVKNDLYHGSGFSGYISAAANKTPEKPEPRFFGNLKNRVLVLNNDNIKLALSGINRTPSRIR
jgi:hypothetical protein